MSGSRNNTALLRTLFYELNKSKIEYLVLRGNQSIEEMASSMDIDILVSKKEKDNFKSILLNLGWLPRRHQWGRYPHIFYDHKGESERVAVTLDIVDSLIFGTELYKLLNHHRIFRTAEENDGIKVPNPWITYFLFILHICFDKGKISESNLQRAKDMWVICCKRKNDIGVLTSIFGERAHKVIEMFASATESWNQDSLYTLKREILKLKIIRKYKTKAIYDKWLNRLKMAFLRPFRVVIIGVDGSGKSTLTKLLLEKNTGYISTGYLGYRQYSTSIAHLLFRLQKKSRLESITHKFLSLLVLIWTPIDMRKRMFNAEAWRPSVVYDRHPEYEIQTNSIILRMRRRWASFIIPKPDMVVLCDGDPNVIWSRKKEMSIEQHIYYRDQLIEIFRKSNKEKYLIRTDNKPAYESYQNLVNILRNSESRERFLYQEYSLLRSSDLQGHIFNILGIKEQDVGKSKVRFGRVVFMLQFTDFIKFLFSDNRPPIFIFEENNGSLFGRIFKTSRGCIKHIGNRIFRTLIKDIKYKNANNGLLIVGGLNHNNNISQIESYSGKISNGTLTIIKKDVVSKVYFSRKTLNNSSRLEVLVRMQKNLSGMLMEKQEVFKIPGIISVISEEKYQEIIFDRVNGSSIVEMELPKILNLLNKLRNLLQESVSQSDRQILCLKDYINACLMEIGHNDIFEKLRSEIPRWLEEVESTEYDLYICHGDFWAGNLIEDQGTVWLIDFDRVSMLPKWYDLVHYLVQMAISSFGGITGWFDKLIITGDMESFISLTVNELKPDFRRHIVEFVNEYSIEINELRQAELWVFRLMAIYLGRMNRVGMGDEHGIPMFLDMINKISRKNKGFVDSIVLENSPS
jgi:thiamine kinase-like enzyme/thymidylate kinase